MVRRTVDGAVSRAATITGRETRLEGFLAPVEVCVCAEMLGRPEALAAPWLLAEERPGGLGQVRARVGLEMAFAQVRLVADFADEWPLQQG